MEERMERGRPGCGERCGERTQGFGGDSRWGLQGPEPGEVELQRVEGLHAHDGVAAERRQQQPPQGGQDTQWLARLKPPTQRPASRHAGRRQWTEDPLYATDYIVLIAIIDHLRITGRRYHCHDGDGESPGLGEGPRAVGRGVPRGRRISLGDRGVARTAEREEGEQERAHGSECAGSPGRRHAT